MLAVGTVLFWIGLHRVTARTTWGHVLPAALTPWQQAAQKEQFRVAFNDPVYRGDRMLYRSGLSLIVLGIVLISALFVADQVLTGVF